MSSSRRHACRMLLPLLLLCCLVRVAPAAESAGSLEERMSYREFTGFGLDKLTPEQLRGLNTWVQAHATAVDCKDAAAPGAAAGAAGSREPVPPPAPQRAAAARVTSRLVGQFSGWTQGQVLTLANGQRWEVRDEEPFHASAESQPRVTVEPGFLSGWTLSVEGHAEVAHVVPASH
jgi:hypothetical protein